MKTFVYTPQIPCGVARTKGYGKTCRIYVLRAPDGFKTLNSRHKVLAYFGTVRMDYGLQRGNARRILNKAEAFCRMVQPPEPRTTREEF